MKMKTILLKSIGAFICFGLLASAQAQNSELNHLLVKKRFPELEKALGNKNISPQEKDLYQVFLLNAYGQPQASNELLKKVRESGMVKTGDSLDYFLQVTQCDNYINLYDYKNAYHQMQVLLKDYASFYNQTDLEEEKQSLVIWENLSGEKAQVLTKKADTRLPLKKDVAGLWRIPLTMNDTTVNFVFDTGAGFSVITATYAQKMGVRLIDGASVPVTSGLTGMVNRVPLGIAPQLVLGNIKVENVVFLVFPDEDLSFANGAYVIEGILGLPVIKEFETFSIEKDELFVPQNPSDSKTLPNMILDQLKPVIYMKYKGELLPFTFDSGANQSDFSNNFYHAFQKEIDQVGQKTSSTIGGAGGNLTREILVMPQLEFSIGDKTAVFKDAQVSTSEISTNGTLYYGNLGQDLIGQFGKMTINFKSSSIVFE